MLSFDPENPVDEAQHWMHFLMRSAVGEINSTFGDGYAKAHPELVGAYLQAGATLISQKAHGSEVGRIAGSLGDVSSSLDRISDNLPSFPVED